MKRHMSTEEDELDNMKEFIVSSDNKEGSQLDEEEKTVFVGKKARSAGNTAASKNVTNAPPAVEFKDASLETKKDKSAVAAKDTLSVGGEELESKIFRRISTPNSSRKLKIGKQISSASPQEPFKTPELPKGSNNKPLKESNNKPLKKTPGSGPSTTTGLGGGKNVGEASTSGSPATSNSGTKRNSAITSSAQVTTPVQNKRQSSCRSSER